MSASWLVRLSREVLEHVVRHGKAPDRLPSPPAHILVQRACYVIIAENPGNMIRAMSGYPLPRYQHLAEEVAQHTLAAVAAGVRRPIRASELSSLRVAVSVLSSLQRITNVEHLNPHVFGLYVRSDRGKYGVLLPQRTGIETAQEQIATALREAGIDGAKEAVTMYRFTVEHHE